MTIYQVSNMNGLADYFVPDQATADSADAAIIDSVKVGTQADAEAKLEQNKTEFLAANSVRFSICLEAIEGNGVVWREYIDTDPDAGTYQVFNTFTGQYTSYPSLSLAKEANEALKQELIIAVGLGSVVTVEALPQPHAQPKSIGAQTL